MDDNVCVDLIIGSGDIKAIGVLAKILASVSFHSIDMREGSSEAIPKLEIGKEDVMKVCHS